MTVAAVQEKLVYREDHRPRENTYFARTLPESHWISTHQGAWALIATRSHLTGRMRWRRNRRLTGLSCMSNESVAEFARRRSGDLTRSTRK